jgi:hypothetical protein
MLIAPKYKELSVYKLWPFIKEVDELMLYFPDYEEDEFPERDFLYTVISTLQPDVTKKLIQEAREKRSVHKTEDEEELVELDSEIKKEIFGVMAQKSNV